MLDFIRNAQQGLDFEGKADAVIASFNVDKVAAEAEAYQSGIAARVPRSNLSEAELIEQGRTYIRANPARFKGFEGLGLVLAGPDCRWGAGGR